MGICKSIDIKKHNYLIVFNPNIQNNEKNEYKKIISTLNMKQKGIDDYELKFLSKPNANDLVHIRKTAIDILAVSTGSLKKQVIAEFENDLSCKGIFIYCYDVDGHKSILNEKNKVLCVTNCPNTLAENIENYDNPQYIQKNINIRNVNVNANIHEVAIVHEVAVVDKTSASKIQMAETGSEFTKKSILAKKKFSVNTFDKHIIDEQHSVANIEEDIISFEEIDKNAYVRINQFINELSLDYIAENDFERFKKELINSFKQKSVFETSLEEIKKHFTDPLSEVKNFKELSKKILYMYTKGTPPKCLLYRILNYSLKIMKSLGIIKYVLIALMMNFRSSFTDFENFPVVYRLTNIEDITVFKVGEEIFSSQFFSTSISANLNDDKFYANRNTAIIIKLNNVKNNPLFFNYFFIKKEYHYYGDKENEVLIAPYTKFKIAKIEKLNGKNLLYLEEMTINSLIYKFMEIIEFGSSSGEPISCNDDFFKSTILYFERKKSYLCNFIDYEDRKKDLLTIYLALSNKYHLTKNFTEAIINLKEALQIQKSLTNSNIGETYRLIGNAFLCLANYGKAEICYESAINSFNEYHDVHELDFIKINNSFAYIKFLQNYVGIAENALKRNVKDLEASKLTQTAVYASSKYQLGRLYFKKKIFDKALNYAQTAIKVKLENDNLEDYTLSNFYTLYADINSKIDRKEEAIKNYKLGLEITLKFYTQESPEAENLIKKIQGLEDVEVIEFIN